mmetsp:Transcript_5531/g.703  ORF Transcript_5531/g.703 Transcript_5531/m.703 type:complete len:91 (+) Transcript_5531:1955-2227(+)
MLRLVGLIMDHVTKNASQAVHLSYITMTSAMRFAILMNVLKMQLSAPLNAIGTVMMLYFKTVYVMMPATIKNVTMMASFAYVLKIVIQYY